MARSRPARRQYIAGIGVDRMGALADASGRHLLRLENLDTDVPPDLEAIERTRAAAREDAANSYLPFVGQDRLRDAAARHVSVLSDTRYERRSLMITANQPFGEPSKVFPDPAVTVAAIDRLVHHATIFEMNVESYRRRTALGRKPSAARLAAAPASAAPPS